MAKLNDRHLVNWVKRFMTRQRLAGAQDEVVVGLSGGKDSMLLAQVSLLLKRQGFLKKVRLVHLDHGLRANSGDQARALERWCRHQDWPLETITLHEKAPASNVELWAREKRREVLQNYCRGELLFLAHHLDDSLEWFLRQLLASSSVPNCYGIPVKNGNIRRPFHCLSRQHIEWWHHYFALPCFEDQSNQDLRFQRNRIRHSLVSPAKELFPSALKHFTEHAKAWARREEHRCQLISPAQGVRYLLQSRGRGHFDGHEQQIAQVVCSLSYRHRGELRQTIRKLVEAQRGGRKGPLHFSGGVKAVPYPGMIIFYNKDGLKNLGQLDLRYAQIIEASTSQIPIHLNPFVVSPKKVTSLPTLKRDPIFPRTIDTTLAKGWWIRPKTHIEITQGGRGADLVS